MSERQWTLTLVDSVQLCFRLLGALKFDSMEYQGVVQPCVRILLAEDNEGDVFLVRYALDKHISDYQLLLAKDGEEALQLLESAGADEHAPCPDFIVLDLNLPRYSGIEILERLRNIPRCAAAPVIVFTSSDSPQDKAQALRLGANRYFRKPSDLAGFMKLGEMVRELLQQSTTADVP